MKVQCSCGAKHAFDITSQMETHPVRFVCPACGMDSSEFVDRLIRQELGQSVSPQGQVVAVGLGAQPEPSSQPLSPPLSNHPPEGKQLHKGFDRDSRHKRAARDEEVLPRCAKHPGQVAAENCRVCSKPICPKCMELFGYVCSPLCRGKAETLRMRIPAYSGQRAIAEARHWRKVGAVAMVAGVFVVAAVGFWFWYAWIGSEPKVVFSLSFPERVYSGRVWTEPKDQLVLLRGGSLIRYDLAQHRQVWSHQLLDQQRIAKEVAETVKRTQAAIDRANSDGLENVPKMPSAEKLTQKFERAAAAELELQVHSQNVWVVSPDKVARYDWDTGNLAKEFPLQAGHQLLRRGDELILMGGDEASLTRIALDTCDTRTESLSGRNDNGNSLASHSPSRKSSGAAMAGMPAGTPGRDAGKAMDPAKVASQAQDMSLPARMALPAVLANSRNQERALSEMNTAPSASAPTPAGLSPEEFSTIPTKGGAVQLSVRMLEQKFISRSAMKPASSKSALEGPVSVGNSTEVANEILNQMQRERGGDVVVEDQSRYQVTLLRPGTKVPAWSGEVVGHPTLYPLTTVSVLAASKLIIVLDQNTKKLWQSSFSYDLAADNGSELEESSFGQGPCVEYKDGLYVFDAGVLTAFDLATGNVRWRYPSVGIAGIFFDDLGMLYVNTTTASPQKLKYSRQIDISQKDTTVVLKLDSRTGKKLWAAEPGGLISYVSGEFVYTVQSYARNEDEESDPHHVDTGFEKLPFLRIKRLNPRNGHQMWEYFQQRAPVDVQFEKNTILLMFKTEAQVVRFLAL